MTSPILQHVLSESTHRRRVEWLTRAVRGLLKVRAAEDHIDYDTSLVGLQDAELRALEAKEIAAKQALVDIIQEPDEVKAMQMLRDAVRK